MTLQTYNILKSKLMYVWAVDDSLFIYFLLSGHYTGLSDCLNTSFRNNIFIYK